MFRLKGEKPVKEQFIKKSSLTKSVQLELLPVGKTRETIEVLGHLEKDEVFRERCEAVKPLIDEYIRDTVSRAFDSTDKNELGELFISLGEVIESDDREIRSTRAGIEEAILSLINQSVESVMPEGVPVKKINSDDFVSKVLLDYFKNDAAKQAAILGVKGIVDILRKFLITRITALTTWMPKRVIENFESFHGNIKSLESALSSPIGPEVRNLISGFMLKDAGYCAFLKQEDIDSYNKAISGISDENGIVEKGLNGIISEYNTSIRGNKDLKAIRKLAKLDKQILMPSEAMFTIQMIENDDEVRELFENITPIRNELERFENILRSSDPADIIIFGDSIRAFSHIAYGDNRRIMDTISEAEEKRIRSELPSDGKKSQIRKMEKEIEKLDAAVTDRKTAYTFAQIDSYMGNKVSEMFKRTFSEACANVRRAEDACRKEIGKARNLRSSETAREAIKDYFEDAWKNIRDLLRIIRPKDSEKANNDFYDAYNVFDEAIYPTIKANHLVRNYITRNVSETVESYDSSFGSAGRRSSKWYIGPGDNKFDRNQNVILQIDGRYYFFILTERAKPIASLLGKDENCRVMIYTKMQKPYQMIPKLTMTRAKAFFAENPDQEEFILMDNLTRPLVIPRDIYEMYAEGLCKKPKITKANKDQEKEIMETFRDALSKVIPIFIQLCQTYVIWSDRPFVFRNPDEYGDLNEFYNDVARFSASLRWEYGDLALIESLVEKEEGLLFEITNKGIRQFYETGDVEKLNEYAQQFMFFFSEENRKNGLSLQLNSRPQLIHREAAAGDPIVHKTGSVLVNRRDVNGDTIPDDIYRQLYAYYNDFVDSRFALTPQAQEYITKDLVVTKKAYYDIIKDRRFYKEQFRIVLSYTKNSECTGRPAVINTLASSYADTANRVILVRNAQDIVYMVAMTANGQLLEKRSLNVIDGIDYYKRLMDLEQQNREKKSDAWEYGGKIKNVRDGYFDKAISEIVKTVLKYDAIIIMEYISDRTRDKGFAMGNNAYKNFEKKLTARLADLHLKGIEEGQPGSISNPYQLCISPESWNNDYQNGIVFFVGSAGLSGTDPESGFNCIFDVSKVHTKEAKAAWLSKFDKLSYDPIGHSLDIAFDYDKFKTYYVPEKSRWEMSLSSGIAEFNREYKFNEYIPHPFDSIAADLKRNGIDLRSGMIEALMNNRLSGKTVDLLFSRILRSLRGIVGSHDGIRMMYVSPVTGMQTDFSYHTAINLGRNFAAMRAGKKTEE